MCPKLLQPYLATESLALGRELGGKHAMFMSLTCLAGAAQTQGQPERAAQLLGAAEALSHAPGDLWANDRPVFEGYVTETRAQLGEAAFARAYGAGQAMTIEQAAGYALEEAPTLPAAATPSAPAAVAGGRPDAAS